MKYKYLSIIGIIMMVSVTSCGGGTSSSSESSQNPSSSSSSSSQTEQDIEVMNIDGKFYNKGNIEFPDANLPIYKAKGYNDVPFINIADFEPILKVEGMGFINFETKGNTLIMSSRDDSNCKIEFDASNNEIHSYNYSQYVGSVNMNNNIGRDYCIVNKMGAIKPSTKTKVVVSPESPKTINLNKYNLKIIKYNDKFYAPLELVNNVLNPNSLHNYVFNGKDLFRFYMQDAHDYPTELSYCYSSESNFYYGYRVGQDSAGANYKKVEPKQGEKYRYSKVDADGAYTNSEYLVLYPDGKGKIFVVENDKEEELIVDGKVTRLSYEENKDVIDIYAKRVEVGQEIDPSKDFYDHHLLINKAKTRYGESTRSDEMSQYTYNLLCFSFDNYYGLQKEENFDTFVSKNNLKERLLSNNVHTYSEAMYQLLLQYVDDGHTAMHSMSIYEYPASYRMLAYKEKYPAVKSKFIIDRGLELYSKRYERIGHGVGNRFVDYVSETAFISFDKFASDGMPSFFSSYKGGDPSYLVEADTCGFMANAMMEIEEYNANPENTTKVKNVVVDITCNGGGAMAALPYVAGLMTSDPKLTVKDVLSNKISEYHYDCNFDGDNKIKTFEGKYNFFLLTSNASFSCGTSLPGMLKGTNVKIIGQKSAGGAAPVTHFTTGSGLAYQTSGSDIIVYKNDKGEYVSIEEGVPVDYEIEEQYWYDLPALNTKLNSLVK